MCPFLRLIAALTCPFRLTACALRLWRDRGLSYTLPRAYRAARRHV